MCDDMVLSLKSDTFKVLKEDFDAVLARTIGNMQMRGADNATITLKLDISISKENCRDWSSQEEGAMRQFQRPSFKHNISSVMQVKDKMTGALTGDMELVYDVDNDEWVLRKLEDAQRSIFDDEPVYADAEVSDVVEAKALPGDVEEQADAEEAEIINHSETEEMDAESPSDENIPFSDIPDELSDDYEYDDPSENE